MTRDWDLLRQFARDNSQDAFAEIVRRHLDLVYSAALRQVRSPQLAEEIAQSVFADLARSAGKLKPDTILTAWLYAVTRRTAIDVIRKEARRQLREQIAVEMNNMNATANDWTQIEPLLDDAMAALDEDDRTAILLRYFENKNLREVGESLGASEDAAQKRMSRAVERLREFFSKRNVTIGASGLMVVISANAVQSAPVGLSAAILTATSGITATVGMTMIHKILIAGFAAAAIGGGIYSFHLQRQISALQKQQTSLNQQIAQLSQERDDAKNRLAALQLENEQLRNNQDELLRLRGEVTRLRQQQNVSTPAKYDVTNKVNLIQILTTARFISIPTEGLQLLGIDWTTDAQGNKTGLIDDQKFKVIRDALAGATDVETLSAPRVVSINGMQVQVSVMRDYSVGDLHTNLGTILEAIPYFSTNSATFDMKLVAQLNLFSGSFTQPDFQTIRLTNQMTLSPGQTVVLEQEFSNGIWSPNFTNTPAGPRNLLIFVTPQIVKDSDFTKPH